MLLPRALGGVTPKPSPFHPLDSLILSTPHLGVTRALDALRL